MTLSIVNTKTLADILITDKGSKGNSRHFEIIIEFNAFHLKGMILFPDCRYGYTEFYVDLKMSTDGEILKHSETGWIKLSKKVGSEASKDQTWKKGVKVGITQTITAELAKENKSGTTSDLEGTFEDYEAELSLLRKHKKTIRWKYKDLPKIQRKELESFLKLYFEWKYAKMPIKGNIKMDIADADFRGINKEVKSWQKPIAKFVLEKQEKVSLTSLESIFKSFEFSE